MKESIIDCPIEFIENSIERALIAFTEEKFVKQGDSDLNNVYFAGATLCLDIKDHRSGDLEVITVCHSDESFGYFSGRIRRLLSIKALKSLEKVIQVAGINHTPKWNY